MVSQLHTHLRVRYVLDQSSPEWPGDWVDGEKK